MRFGNEEFYISQKTFIVLFIFIAGIFSLVRIWK
jgi:hypothetical protein